MSNDLHKTILTLLSENTEKEKIENLGGTARKPQDERKDWEQKAKPMKGLNSTIQTDTGKVVPAEPFGVMPDGGQWEYQWRGDKLDAANGTYTDQGEYNRQKFKQIVQQPAEPVHHTSTTVSESKTRLDKILETVDQIFESSYQKKKEIKSR